MLRRVYRYFWPCKETVDCKESIDDINTPEDVTIEKETESFCNDPVEHVPMEQSSCHDTNANCISIPTSPETQTTVVATEPSCYYAVCLPEISVLDMNSVISSCVFEDKDSSLALVKANPGARFKVFQKLNDAVKFSMNSEATKDKFDVSCCLFKNYTVDGVPCFEFICPEKSPSSYNAFPTIPFPMPTRDEIATLRNYIKMGNSEAVKFLIFGNPRYLITSVDKPRILKEGQRYNALHLATMHMKPNVCLAILAAVSDPSLINDLYPNSSPECNEKTRQTLVDFYLNMPDKGCCETPLHFAAKFGCLKSVQILLSFPACDKSIRNKFGLTPNQVVCLRNPSADLELQQKIMDAFEDQYVVPVMRAEDTSLQPFIGEPVSLTQLSKVELGDDDTVFHPRAAAGPMTKRKAEKLYKEWKTPPRVSSRELFKIRMSDNEKGIEQIGRFLAHSMDAEWTEFWPYFDAWCDLTTEKGLCILEKHLSNLTEQGLWRRCLLGRNHSTEVIDSFLTSPIYSTTPSNLSESDGSDISEICHRLQGFSFSEVSESYYTNLCESVHSDAPCEEEDIDIKFDPQQHGANVESDNLNFSCKSFIEPSEESLQNSELDYDKIGDTENESNKAIDSKLVANDFIEEFKLTIPLENDGSETAIVGDTEIELCHAGGETDSVFSECFGNKSILNPKVYKKVKKISYLFSCVIVNIDDEIQLVSALKELTLKVEDILSILKDTHLIVAKGIYDHVQCTYTFLDHEQHFIAKCLVKCRSYGIFNERKFELIQQTNCVLRYLQELFARAKFKHICECGHSAKESSKYISDAEEDNYATPIHSSASGSGDSDDKSTSITDELAVYIDGFHRSKADVDVLKAIENVDLDPVKFPHIYKWKNLVLLEQKEQIYRQTVQN